jgi:alpha-beta hydrolase superfamily lysophospholipase
MSAFNVPFAPARTDFDWLSRDDAKGRQVRRRPRCGFGLDVPGGGKALLDGARRMTDPAQVAQMREDHGPVRRGGRGTTLRWSP